MKNSSYCVEREQKDEQRAGRLRGALVVLLLGAVAAPALWAGDETFLATIKNDSRGEEECLIFGDSGFATHPERFNWGPGPYCGFPGGKEALIDNGQAIWTLVHLGDGEYVITNGSNGQDECLIFGDSGFATHPERFNWDKGPFCGFPGGEKPLRLNGQAVWKLTHLEGELYTMTNASRGEDECLIFGNSGFSTHPERFNWDDGPFCGFPGGREGLLANRQAVFQIERVCPRLPASP